MTSLNRRHLLQAAAGGALAGQFAFLSSLPRVTFASEKARGAASVQPSIEPLVRLIEETPREQLLERVAERIRKGAAYQDVLAGLMLAAVRNVQPYPSVGFKFHAVLVVNSCHLASMAGPDNERWLPLFWALDHFKSAQAEEAEKTGWRLPELITQPTGGAEGARREFHEAFTSWDLERADRATAAVVRHCGAQEVFQLFSRYAARDFRSIGHKAIYLANAWRSLQTIGWEHAEPVMRSLAWALQNHQGESNPATSDLPADRSWKQNDELVQQAANLDGDAGDAADTVLAELRSLDDLAAGRMAFDQLKQGASSQSLWDGIFLSAAELLMRQPGIVALHAMTTANAMHYLWEQTADPQLRGQLLLQAMSFTASFRQAMSQRGTLRNITIAEHLSRSAEANGAGGVEEVFQVLSRDRDRAATQLQKQLDQGADPHVAIDAARRLIFLKGSNAHDYKFSSAVLEDFYHLSPQRRNTLLALSVYQLRGAGDRTNSLVDRVRAAFTS